MRPAHKPISLSSLWLTTTYAQKHSWRMPISAGWTIGWTRRPILRNSEWPSSTASVRSSTWLTRSQFSQQGLLTPLPNGTPCPGKLSTDPLTPEEQFAVLLIHSDPDPSNGLKSYIDNLMNVMAFDAGRRGRYITRTELDAYSTWLATAVTEAMHYFIGHCCELPHCAERYQAVTAAHITHMLRDMTEDLQAGYFNIPSEILAATELSPIDLENPVYLQWVRSQVELARSYFSGGKRYLAQVQSTRCRLAGFAYAARFEGVLDVIERDGYHLRAHYPEIGPLKASLVSLRASLPPPHISNRYATNQTQAANPPQASNLPQATKLPQ